MRTLRLTAGLAMLLLMTGCATKVTTEVAAPGPTTTPSSEPTPEPTIDPAVTTAVLFGTRIEWRNDAGEVLDTLRFDVDSEVFRLNLERHLGPADPTQPLCAAYAYGEALSVTEWDPGFIEVFVSAPEVGGIRFETPSGITIGDDATQLFEATPAEHRFDWSTISLDFPGWKLLYDQTGTVTEGTPEPMPFGAGAVVHDMRVDGFGHMAIGHTVDDC